MINNRYICKAKRIDNNEWVEGYYVCLNGDRHFIYTGYAETDCGTYYPDCHEVIPETVGQCTGLKDKNGKLIFEGDIIEYKFEYGKITYSESEAMYIAEFDTWCTDFDHIEAKDVEVISNIHDNPELLEVK